MKKFCFFFFSENGNISLPTNATLHYFMKYRLDEKDIQKFEFKLNITTSKHIISTGIFLSTACSNDQAMQDLQPFL